MFAMTTRGKSSSTPTREQLASMRAIKLKHPVRIASGIVVALLSVLALESFISNERVGWDIVGHYLFSRPILVGLGRTLILTFVAMAVGLLIGAALAIMRLSSNPVLKNVAAVYVWLFRGTPLLVQLILWYNISALYPTIRVGIPFGPTIMEGDANTIINVWTAAILGLGLNEGAYLAEIIRAGLISVDRGQTEAAEALGMTSGKIFRKVVLPQALRMIIPPTGNQVINMLKVTALVSVIALPELLYSAQLIYNQSFETIPLLITVSIWYLTVTSVLTVIQFFIERAYNRGVAGRSTARVRRLEALDGAS